MAQKSPRRVGLSTPQFIGGIVVVMLPLLALGLHLWLKCVETQDLSRRVVVTAPGVPEAAPSKRVWPVDQYMTRDGGSVIFGYKISRLVAQVALLALSIVTSQRYGWTKLNIVLLEAIVCPTPVISI